MKDTIQRNQEELTIVQKHVVARIANTISKSNLSDEKKLSSIRDTMYLYERSHGKNYLLPFDATSVLR